LKLIMLFLTALFAVDALYAGKIKWDSSGNPIMEKPKKPVKGCQRGGLEELATDKNSSSCSGS